jgi:hypothetical protein
MVDVVKAVLGVAILGGIGYVAYKYLLPSSQSSCNELHPVPKCEASTDTYWACTNNEYVDTDISCADPPPPTPFAAQFGAIVADGVSLLYGQGGGTHTIGREQCDVGCPGTSCWIPPFTWTNCLNPKAKIEPWSVEVLDQFGVPLPNWNVQLEIEQSDDFLGMFVNASAKTYYCRTLAVKTDSAGKAHFNLMLYKKPPAMANQANFWITALNTGTGYDNYSIPIIVTAQSDGCQIGQPYSCEGYTWTRIGCDY